MSQIKTFDLLNSPLEGTNLIEAGAGTGKTYVVTGLFLRLVVEGGIPVDRILVVTFTEAATEELKQRIRDRLRDAFEALLAGGSGDPFLNGMVQKERRPDRALRRLKEALRAFDQAAIATIHGFCRRILMENAFESGGLFDTELIPFQDELYRGIAEDFWRLHLYTASPLFAGYCLDRGLSPETLVGRLPNRIAMPDLKVIPRPDAPDTGPLEAEFQSSFEEMATIWPAAWGEVREILLSDKSLNRTRYPAKSVPAWLRRMEAYAASPGPHISLFKGFEAFTAGQLGRSVKKGQAAPAHPYFECCERHGRARDRLLEAFRAVHIRMISDFIPYAESELQRRGLRRNVQTFDDLLLSLHRALRDQRGPALAEAVAARFKAALIDEFQDTDPVQYDIFKRVFNERGTPLFFVGDPKQAIYSFRGADIFAYMRAASEVSVRYTLTENWRSNPDYLSAVNALFARRRDPFVYRDIVYHPARPARGKAPLGLKLGADAARPLEVWLVNAERLTGSASAIGGERATEIISRAVAGEVARLLRMGQEGRAVVGGRALKAEDIAVLVRSNREARLIRDALSALRVSAVLYGSGDLFDTREAMETERLLSAVARPEDDRLLAAALATDILGVAGEALGSLLEDPEAWEEWTGRFAGYREGWERGGFILMFRELLSREQVLPRLMAFPDGERRCTNLLHLSEVLQRTEAEKGLGTAALLKWLSGRRRPSAKRTEEHLLRLESDERAVRVITIHKSKGLEYPVVFCPFAWHGSRIKPGQDPFVLFHDEADCLRLTLDMGSDQVEEHLKNAEKEVLAENLRLLYVALTRAQCMCYLVWGRMKGAETSAPAYLLHGPGTAEGPAPVDETAARFKALLDEDLAREVREAAAGARHAVRVREIPLEDGQEALSPSRGQVVLSCRRFTGEIRRDWTISSFSSLVSGLRGDGELPDHDVPVHREAPGEEEAIPAEETRPLGIFDFPKGARAGIFMHDLMEHLEFTVPAMGAIRPLVVEKLAEYGYDAAWLGPVGAMARNVLDAPLDDGRGPLRLSRIPREDRLAELEFYFPLRRLTTERLRKVLETAAGIEFPQGLQGTLERLDFAPAEGYMKGFMDLVFRREDRFYLVDWKSNHLGDAPDDYAPPALAAAMEAHGYILQYTLYTLALDRYLKNRLPGYSYEKNFGGVFYIFMRGVDAESGLGYGIYRDRPSVGLVELLGREMMKPAGSPASPAAAGRAEP